MPKLFQVPAPDSAELWHIDKKVYVVYYVPGTKIPMAWHVQSTSDWSAITGGKDVPFAKELTKDQYLKAGGHFFGTSTELANLTDHPFEEYAKVYDREVKLKPWLADPEVQAIWLGATMEGRTPDPGELQSTNWWKTHNDAQRAWITLNAQDPSTAAQTMDSNRRRIRDALVTAGIAAPPKWLVETIARQYTNGELTDVQLGDAIRSIADPYSGIKLPKSLQEAFSERDLTALDHTQAGEDRVRDLVRTYLGPRYGQWDEEKVARWAGKLRNDPDAEQQLTQTLSNQLKSLYGTKDTVKDWDPTTTWDDLASPWISLASETWGQRIEPGDALVDKLIRMNDAEEAGTYLRKTGLNRNITSVVNSTMDAMLSSFDMGIQRIV